MASPYLIALKYDSEVQFVKLVMAFPATGQQDGSDKKENNRSRSNS